MKRRNVFEDRDDSKKSHRERKMVPLPKETQIIKIPNIITTSEAYYGPILTALINWNQNRFSVNLARYKDIYSRMTTIPFDVHRNVTDESWMWILQKLLDPISLSIHTYGFLNRDVTEGFIEISIADSQSNQMKQRLIPIYDGWVLDVKHRSEQDFMVDVYKWNGFIKSENFYSNPLTHQTILSKEV